MTREVRVSTIEDDAEERASDRSPQNSYDLELVDEMINHSIILV